MAVRYVELKSLLLDFEGIDRLASCDDREGH